MIKLRMTAGVVLFLSLALFMSTGCSDKTQTSENKALTKQRQDLINNRKNNDNAQAVTQGNKQNTGD